MEAQGSALRTAAALLFRVRGLVHAAEMVGERSCAPPAADDGDRGRIVDAAGVAELG